MIAPIVRTSFRALRRDRGAFILTFVLPVAFFSIFAVIFGQSRNATAKISVAVVDLDNTSASQRLVAALEHESSLNAFTAPKPKKDQPAPQPYTAETALAGVKVGDFQTALIIPKGFSENPISFGPPTPGRSQPQVEILHDSSDPISVQIVGGMLQKVVMTSMGDLMADQGMKFFEQAAGGLTPQQKKSIGNDLSRLRQLQQRQQSAPATYTGGESSLVAVKVRDVVGENKKSPMVSFYAAGIGVMFLLFTASTAGGSLLDESDSGALDRVLSSHITMTSLMAGKMVYSAMLAFSQLCVMFLWGWAVFHLDLFSHVPGFLVMGMATAFAVANFGMILASLSKTRAQQGAIGTLLILTMSAVGGSMFPRFLMPETMKKAGLLTINGWAIDGFTKVFWYDEPVAHLAPQVGVLLAIGVVLFLIARRVARRWEWA
jgi:ABC-2 type transport system permease protein